MSGQHGDGSVISPLSADTAQPHGSLHHDPEANAPEVVDISASPYHHQHSSSGASPTVAGSSPGTVHSTAYSPAAAAHYNSDQGKEVLHYDASGKIALSAEEYTHYPQAVSDLYAKDEESKGGAAAVEAGGAAGAKGKKILGMRRNVFFIVLAVVCIAIAVALGAGVGATVKNKSNSSDNGKANPSDDTGGSGSSSSSSSSGGPGAPSTSSGSSPSGTSDSSSPDSSSSSSPTKASSSDSKTASSSATTTTSSATATPTFLNQTSIHDGQGWGFQGFSDTNYAGDYSEVFLNDPDYVETDKGLELGVAANSYQWTQRGTDCCVSFCSNDTHAGWLGYQCQAKKQPKTSDTFTRVWVWCSDDHQRPNAERCGPA